jgi:hypothetical protein
MYSLLFNRGTPRGKLCLPRRLKKIPQSRIEFETWAGIEPAHKSFADSRVTTSPPGLSDYGIIPFMISDSDLIQLQEVFPTRKEFGELSNKVDGLQEQVGDLKVEVGEVNDKIDLVLEKMDSFVGAVRTLETENGAGAAILSRHAEQIEVLAKHSGIKFAN